MYAIPSNLSRISCEKPLPKLANLSIFPNLNAFRCVNILLYVFLKRQYFREFVNKNFFFNHMINCFLVTCFIYGKLFYGMRIKFAEFCKIPVSHAVNVYIDTCIFAGECSLLYELLKIDKKDSENRKIP